MMRLRLVDLGQLPRADLCNGVGNCLVDAPVELLEPRKAWGFIIFAGLAGGPLDSVVKDARILWLQ